MIESYKLNLFVGSGLRCQAVGDFGAGRPARTKKKRGKVRGLSYKSRARLMAFLLEYESEGQEWAISLTLRVVESPDEWRRRWHIMSVYLRRRGLPVVWRVELQRRGVPHLHFILWGSEDDCLWVRDTWLAVWGVADDPDHQAYAVDIRPAGGGWYTYVVLHQGKVGDQCGWQGRQWGVVNRKLFHRRACAEYVLSGEQYDYFRRMMCVILRLRGRRSRLPLASSWSALGLDKITLLRVYERAKRLAK